MALRCHPAGRVSIPLVLCARERAETRLYVFPATLVLERVADGLGDERATLARSDAPVELLDELIVKAYVQTHGHKLAHNLTYD
jgi:hypothetical protein